MARRDAVLLVADERQFPPAMFLAGKLAALKGRRDVDVIVASNSKSALATAADFDAAVTLLDLSAVDGERRLPVRDYFTRATYLRLFVPHLIAATHRRILYLDNDCYPADSRLFALFDLAMDDHSVAAVRDLSIPFVINPANAAELRATLGITGGDFTPFFGAKYLNSGVLLMSIEAYRRSRMEKKMAQLLERTNPRYLDQTLLNAVLKTQWLELSPRFNMVAPALSTFIAGFVQPAIIHFTGPSKPWHSDFQERHPVRGELEAFLRNSPWTTYLRDVNPITLGGNAGRRVAAHRWLKPAVVPLLRYLGETTFADVEQGFTQTNPAALAIDPNAIDGMG
jgi:lipopolysaccharide biosynthesis glycosyltransferase